MADPLVVDTDLVIDFLRGRGDGATAMRGWLREGRVRLTAVTAYELRAGLDFDRRRDVILTLLTGRTLPLDAASALAAGRVRRQLEGTGLGIGTPDQLQAGICLRHGLALATRNRRHFERIEGLQLAELPA